jgi:hypothetical protein
MVNTNAQPITLQVGNAETNGVRPLSYRFEIASDPNFTAAVFTKDGVPQDPSGRTSLTLPGPLSAERKYYWRSRAEDGANTGPFGATSAFHVFTPVVFGAPTLLSPINGEDAGTLQPRFLFANASHSGPVGPIYYLLEVSTSASFGSIHAAWQFPESSGQTELVTPASLLAGQYFWRVRAFDGGHTGPYSSIQSFTASGGVGGGGGGGFNPGQPCARLATPFLTLQACRNDYPASMSAAQVGELLNKVAWEHRSDGWGVLGKSGGNNCPSPQGVPISTDYLVRPTGGGHYEGYDVLSNAGSSSFGPGPSVPTWNGPEDLTDAIANGERTYVAPVTP